jgi:glutathione S-transferase
VITLYQFDPAFGLPNASPFCMKVETYLRMAGLDYQAPPGVNIMQAPKGKMPWIDDDGQVVADSTFIVAYLKQRYGDRLDSRLNAPERATALAFQRLMEEDLYWALLYSRWFEDDGWTLTRAAFFSRLPPVARSVVPALARRGMRKEIWGHGMGRHSREEIYAIGQADITALAEFLADKPFFMGPQPSSLDASAYAFLANLLWCPLETPLKACAKAFPGLEAYCRRMKARYYSVDGTVH